MLETRDVSERSDIFKAFEHLVSNIRFFSKENFNQFELPKLKTYYKKKSFMAYA